MNAKVGRPHALGERRGTWVTEKGGSVQTPGALDPPGGCKHPGSPSADRSRVGTGRASGRTSPVFLGEPHPAPAGRTETPSSALIGRKNFFCFSLV